MNREVDQRTTELGRPLAPPRDRVVRRSAAPRRLRRREIRAARDPTSDEQLELLEPVAEAVLEDRHHASARSFLGGGHFVRFAERSGERLLADHVPPRLERQQCLPHVQEGRRTDVDDVELVDPAHLGEIRDGARDPVPGGELAQPVLIHVADRHDFELLGQAPVRLDVQSADATADDSDLQWATHPGVPSLTAFASASSASWQARKQCVCDIAVSVRFRTSAISWRP